MEKFRIHLSPPTPTLSHLLFCSFLLVVLHPLLYSNLAHFTFSYFPGKEGKLKEIINKRRGRAKERGTENDKEDSKLMESDVTRCFQSGKTIENKVPCRRMDAKASCV